MSVRCHDFFLLFMFLFIYFLFQDAAMHRCSISAESQIENSESNDSTDEETLGIKKNGYQDAENEVDQETDGDPVRVLGGKLSETSGYARSDLYDYTVIFLSLSLSLSHTHPGIHIHR